MRRFVITVAIRGGLTGGVVGLIVGLMLASLNLWQTGPAPLSDYLKYGVELAIIFGLICGAFLGILAAIGCGFAKLFSRHTDKKSVNQVSEE
jgi:hypothetical protein